MAFRLSHRIPRQLELTLFGNIDQVVHVLYTGADGLCHQQSCVSLRGASINRGI